MQRFLFVLVLALGTLCGCEGGHGDAGAQKMEVRVYQVPPDSTNALMQTLNKVFETGDKTSLGKVSSPSPGQLVVLAPASLQGSVEASLRALAKDLPAGAGTNAAVGKPEGPLRLSFWSVDAIPEAGDDDTALAALAPALDEARKQLGAVHFELRDEVSGVTSVGKKADRSWVGVAAANGSPLPKQLEYSLTRNAADFELSIGVSDQIPVRKTENGQSIVQYMTSVINTTTAVRLGQTLVLTQSPIPDSESSAATPGTLTRLYLVRVDEVAAP
jgi:hypothetical protein